jgi:hypothetical protein
MPFFNPFAAASLEVFVMPIPTLSICVLEIEKFLKNSFQYLAQLT